MTQLSLTLGSDPVSIIANLRELGADLAIVGGRPLLRAAGGAKLPPELVAAVRASRDAIVASLLEEMAPRERFWVTQEIGFCRAFDEVAALLVERRGALREG